jgi:hypothetical protein
MPVENNRDIKTHHENSAENFTSPNNDALDPTDPWANARDGFTPTAGLRLCSHAKPKLTERTLGQRAHKKSGSERFLQIIGHLL